MIQFEAPYWLALLAGPLALLLFASRPQAQRVGSSLVDLWREAPLEGAQELRHRRLPPLSAWLAALGIASAILGLAGPYRVVSAGGTITVLLDQSASMQLEAREQRVIARIEEWAAQQGVKLAWRREIQPQWDACDREDYLWASDALARHPARAGLCLSGARPVPGPVGREGEDALVFDGAAIQRQHGRYPAAARQVRVRGALPADLKPLWELWCADQQLVSASDTGPALLELEFPAQSCAPDRDWNSAGFEARVGLAPGTGTAPRLDASPGRVVSNLCAIRFGPGSAVGSALHFSSLWEAALLDPPDCVPLAERSVSGEERFVPPRLEQLEQRESWVRECLLAALMLVLLAWWLRSA